MEMSILDRLLVMLAAIQDSVGQPVDTVFINLITNIPNVPIVLRCDDTISVP